MSVRHEVLGLPGWDNALWVTVDGGHDTARIIGHRFQGFLWNLDDELEGSWSVADIGKDAVRTTRYELHEGFTIAHAAGERPFTGSLLSREGYSVETMGD